MSVKKLSFYLGKDDITVRSDHLPFKRFLEENTLNSKVNNLAMKIEQYWLTCEDIKGIRNTLADAMCRLITTDPDTCKDPEPEGQVYRYCVFKELPNVSTVKEVSTKADITLN